MANRFCRVCCSSLGANQYLLVKHGALSIAGEALLRLAELNCRAELRDGEAPRLCRSCYDTVVRMKKTYNDLEGKKAALQEKLSTARTFFLGSKHVRVSSPKSRIPTPMKSPASKRQTMDRPHSARTLFSAQAQTSSLHEEHLAVPISELSEHDSNIMSVVSHH